MPGIRGAVAVAGVGESAYYKHGRSPDREFVLTIKAILAACDDAGISPKSLDGFVSFADDRNGGIRVANALGVREMRWSTMQWGGGGAGGAAAVQQAAAAVAAGFAETVVVYRGLSQGEFGRFGGAAPRHPKDSLRVAYGANSPGEWSAPRMMRYLHETGIDPSAQRAVSMAAYFHAQQNPRAVMYGKPLSEDTYEASRWIVEPWRLYDFCQENDGAAALIVTSAERARDLTDTPAYLLAAAQGASRRAGAFVEGIYDSPLFATAEFTTVAPRLFAMAGLTPKDVDVAQSYENFSGAVVVSLIEHGFCTPDEAAEFFTVENLTAPGGGLPLNTSGGNLAEAYIHGLELCVEAVRQIRGDSPNPVPGAKVSFVSSGPMVIPASDALFGTEEALG